MLSRTSLLATCVGFVLAFAAPSAHATIWHVDASAAPGGDGTSWPQAFNDLQSALEAAQAGDPADRTIWVAAGRYVPRAETVPGDPRSATFTLIDGLEMYGGFPPGGGDGTFAARRPMDPAYETILSGDLAGNDGPDPFQNNDENAYTVVSARSYDTPVSAVLDGLTITRGNGDYGGGARVGGYDKNLLLRQCVIRENAALAGGGIRFNHGLLTLDRCEVVGNAALSGGGVRAGDSGIFFAIKTVFHKNAAGSGGAIAASGDGPHIVLDQCVLADNTAQYLGGAIDFYEAWHYITNTLIVANSAEEGGGMYLDDTGYYTTAVINCTIADNVASVGGGICASHSSYDDYYLLANSILRANVADDGPQIALTVPYSGSQHDEFTVSHCNVDCGPSCVYVPPPEDPDGEWSLIWDETNITDPPQFLDSDGPDDNPQTWEDNDYRLAAGSPCVDTASNDYLPGGVTRDLSGSFRITDGNDDRACVVDMGAYERPGPLCACADVTRDGVVNLADFHTFALCFGLETSPACTDCDLDANGEVNLADFSTFTLLFLEQPSINPPPNCLNQLTASPI